MNVGKELTGKKAIILIGPRQVGKTTFLHQIMDNISGTLLLNCDEPDVKQILTNATSTDLKNIIGDSKIVLIDEAQRVKNIGLTLKLLVDNFKNTKVIVSGSSALEMANEINEPLTGRKIEFTMFPLSTQELIEHHGKLNERRNLSQRLIFGSYPDVINYPENAGKYINELTNSYLYKDIFNYQDIRKPELLPALLEALARQMGSEVSYHELANLLKTDNSTIIRYIDLLEKSFVIFRLRSYSNNLRNELKRSRKIYFYDNGIRNALIANFNPLELRTDVGALWENFLVAERLKYLSYNQIISNRFFWRTKQQQEIDYIEERGGKLHSFEFKWNENSKAKFSKTFTNAYPDAELKLVTPKNYISFLTET